MYYLIILIMCFNAIISAQGNIAQFAVWKPKDGQAQKFEEGYKKHLEWHKQNNDTWDWYGWYIVSGPRYGQFVDATLNHTWNDFDSPVNPQGDRADNNLNVFPYAELQTVFKVAALEELSTPSDRAEGEGLRSRLIRYLTISFNSFTAAKEIIANLKSKYSGLNNFYAYKIVDGGDINRAILMLGFKSWDDYGKSNNLAEDLFALDKDGIISSVISETMVYREDMSLFYTK